MANRVFYPGFRPYGELLRVTPYTANGTINPGDLVMRVLGSGTADTELEVQAATATQALMGASLTYATNGNRVLVADHEDQLFQAGSTGTPVAGTSADLGKNANINAQAAVGKVSQHAIDATTFATTATLPIKVLGILRVQDVNGNSLASANCRYICKINNHQLAGGTGVAGV